MIQTLGGFGWGGTWRYGKELYDLKGTARTLDEADGEIELDHGINSMYGYSVLDDSRSMVLCEQPENPFGMWVQPRAEGDRRPVLFRLRPRLRRLRARFLPPVRQDAASAALGARQLVEPLP